MPLNGVFSLLCQSTLMKKVGFHRAPNRGTSDGMQRSDNMPSLLRRFANDERGATAIEYGLIAALIALVVIGSVGTVGNNLKNKFNNVANAVK